ncbi:hypothetical protein [Rhodoferax sp.]|uniref:hypothetical protein n=1 Tax=Rhodoferax sp. TaxID=50421 RepID=UPI002611BF26|nr:hypothetical protein [Rhodoferax sp.]MDD2927064.1 hypothetical protein [Rhodoferax sp.]
MGYATIVSGGKDGLYQIKIDLGTELRTYLVNRFSELIEVLDKQIKDVQLKLDDAEQVKNIAQATADNAIQAFSNAGAVDINAHQALFSAMTKALANALKAEGAAASWRHDLKTLQAAITEKKKIKSNLQALVLEREISAWCVDLTEHASSVVATMEIPGEAESILVAPGGRFPDLKKDGFLRARELMTPAQAFFSAAILPGWQRFKPTYRKGRIASLNKIAHTATVTLDAAHSSAQNLSVNQADTLDDVPVEYMTCHAAAFEVGDRCVVQFAGQSWASPKVVGFVEHPRGCNWACIYLDGFYYKYGFQSKKPDLLNALMTGAGVVVDWRENRGAWNVLPMFVSGQNGAVTYSEWKTVDWSNNPSLICAKGYFSMYGVDSRFDGVVVQPWSHNANGSPGVLEFRIRQDGQVVFNAAVY